MISTIPLDAEEALKEVCERAQRAAFKERDSGSMQIYAPIDDLELAHRIVKEFGGLQGIASELKLNYEDAPTGTRVRILTKLVDFITVMASKANMDTTASIPELQHDMEVLSKALLERSLVESKTKLTFEQ